MKGFRFLLYLWLNLSTRLFKIMQLHKPCLVG